MNQLPLFPLFDPDVGNPIVDLSGRAIRLGDCSDSVSGGNGGQVAVNPDVAVKGTEIVSDTAIQCGLPDSPLFLKRGGFLQNIPAAAKSGVSGLEVLGPGVHISGVQGGIVVVHHGLHIIRIIGPRDRSQEYAHDTECGDSILHDFPSRGVWV